MRRKGLAFLVLLGAVALLAVLVVHWLPGIGTRLDLRILSASQTYAQQFEARPAGARFLLPLLPSVVGYWRACRPVCWRRSR